ncbi:MAG: GAF domain-containing sensor histidine kinase [Desulfotomaculum sp.]|nr:GAF domain-containing sensor histidine kinase [Desulfotomaculum sp.]
MAHILKVINNQKAVVRRKHAIDMVKLLHPSGYKQYPNEIMVKNAALERLIGVKNSTKTHYSELKKSIIQMQKCNINLSQSQKEIEELYELLKKKAAQTLAILEVSRAVSNILPFDQILKKTNKLVAQVLGPVKCYLLGAKKGRSITFASLVVESQGQDILFTQKNMEEKWERVKKDNVPVVFSEESDKTYILLVPLVSRGELIGALVIKRQDPGRPFTEEEVELCVGIAGPVAVAIENRALVEKLEKESQRLKIALLSLQVISDNLAMLNKGVEPLLFAIGQSLIQITDAKYAIIMMQTDRLASVHVPEPCAEKEVLDAYFSTLTADHDFSYPYGICRLNVKNDQSLGFMRRRYGFEDVVIFPMMIRNKPLGLIILFFPRYKSDAVCQSILQILGNQTAIVLENARLFEDTLRLKDKAEAHYRVACQQKEQLEQKNRELKNMYNILFRAREEQAIYLERNRIASDLHDNVLQILFAIGLHLEWCFNELSPQSPVYAKLKYLEGLVNKAVTEVRTVVCESGSKEASFSLQESIESLVRDLNQAGSVGISVQTSGTVPKLPATVRNIAFRIVQEALVNALRHASATKIKIYLSYCDKKIVITVIDNGIGINENIMENLPDENKFGIKNMLQRAQYINGTLKIRRLNSGGTEIHAVIPVEGVD